MTPQVERRRRTGDGAATPILLAAALALLAAGAASAQNNPSFRGVGDLAGGAYDSVAEAVSDNGQVVVGGSASASGPEAFRWTLSGGIQGLGDLSGGLFQSHANGVSADGAVIAGTGVNSSDNSRAFRWTSGGGMVALNAFTCSGCDAIAFGNAVSANGLVVVGGGLQKGLFELNASFDAARWTGGGTSISGMGHLSGGGDASEALGASSTGSVIVGSSDSSTGVRGFRWTSGGMVALANVAGAQVNSAALDVSDDGNVVVGFANTSAVHTYQREAVRWVGPGFAAELLGSLPGAPSPNSRAVAVSPDGTRIVGSANDENSLDAAFLWDAAGGMRKLSSELTEQYGLDLGGWRLIEARGISAPNGAGDFVIVGDGINPAGQPEGWVAVLSRTACNDGVDNDGDGQIDAPDDPQCTALGDRSEIADCSDGLDNDGNGQTDYPADPKCTSAADQTERFDCGDAFDNDGDGNTDFPADPGCRDASWPRENPACQNGVDDDGDGTVDFPADAGCNVLSDLSETGDCGNGIDDDGDGLADHPADPDCASTLDLTEFPQCSDGLDNDGDSRVDYPDAYPGCQSAGDRSENTNCANGLDDDGDTLVDAADPGCLAFGYGSESPVDLALGDLLVLDRRGKTLLRLDLASGAQTPISSGAWMGDPQGVAVRPSGAVVVADPAGLLEVGPGTGAQRRMTGALDDSLSLQVVFDAAGDPVVLTFGGLVRAPWTWAGLSSQVPLLTLPAPGSIAVFQGDALARETSGSYVVGGFGLLGDGVYRIAADGSSTSKVTPGFSGDVWQDFAVEANGTILAAGNRFGVGPGVFRIDPATGAVTALSATGWTAPSAVAVAPDGRIFAADAGTCTTSGCTGAEVVELSPASGARLQARSGGLLTGEMDLAVVTALPTCNNGVDDDGDGYTDFPADDQCDDFHEASELPDCRDGLDNDGDGLVDAPADPGCLQLNADLENPACDDGLDNDRDGTVDWDGGPGGAPVDAYCDTPSKGAEGPSSCGLGAELPFLLPLLYAWRRRRRA